MEAHEKEPLTGPLLFPVSLKEWLFIASMLVEEGGFYGFFSRKTLFFKVSLCIILTFPGQFILVPHTIAQPSLAPLNPEFLQYITDREKREFPGSAADSSGYLPPPVDLSHLTGLSAFPIKQFSVTPSSYDLRTLGKVTSVKNQRPCSACWTFAVLASIESILLPSEYWDFSENNIKNTHGFDNGPCEPGNYRMATAYLARWSGPVNEAEDPYDPYSINVSPADLPVRKHIQEALILPNRAGPLDNDNIKEAIVRFGAVASTMEFRNLAPYYNPTNYAYYFNGLKETGHAVAIVGWDDNFPKERFSITPPGDGAFIAKNSWGEEWGENGFFYISYYDSIIGSGNFVFNGVEPTTNYSHIYQYDPLGWTSSCGAGVGSTAWFANVFSAIASDSLKAVSFYTASLESTYEIYIYLNTTAGPVSGSLAGTKSGSISLAGYHTIRLDSPIPLTAGQMLSVVVRLTTPNYSWPIPIELPKSGYSTAASAGAGQSYFSADGAQWWDLTTTYPNANVCLKAFTGNVFADIPPGYWAQDYINAIYHAGITTGYGDGRFGPDDFVTREQMAKFIIKAIAGEPAENYCESGVPFTDVTADMWSCRFIKRLKELGITKGYQDGRYGPKDLISREQMAVFLVVGIGEVPSDKYCDTGVPFTDVTADMWSCGYIKRLAVLGISMGYGDGRYGPYDAVTRAQMAVFLARAFLGM